MALSTPALEAIAVLARGPLSQSALRAALPHRHEDTVRAARRELVRAHPAFAEAIGEGRAVVYRLTTAGANLLPQTGGDDPPMTPHSAPPDPPSLARGLVQLNSFLNKDKEAAAASKEMGGETGGQWGGEIADALFAIADAIRGVSPEKTQGELATPSAPGEALTPDEETALGEREAQLADKGQDMGEVLRAIVLEECRGSPKVLRRYLERAKRRADRETKARAPKPAPSPPPRPVPDETPAQITARQRLVEEQRRLKRSEAAR